MGLIKRYAYKFTDGAAAALGTGLTSHWRLQEPSGVRYDFKGANNLADNATVTQATGPGGVYPQAALFTRANSEFLNIADNAALSTGDIDFTVYGWLYLTSDPAADMVAQAKWTTAGSDKEWRLFFRTSDDKMVFGVSADGAADTTAIAQSGTVVTATWYFVVAWHDSVANTINIQVNDGTVASTAHATGLTDQGGEFRIGASGDGSFWDGRQCGAGFTKEVLSAAERTLLYNAGVPVDPQGVPNVEATAYTFPLTEYEYAPSQALRVPRAPIGGADYDVRLLGTFPGLKGAAQERIRFIFPGTGGQQDTEADAIFLLTQGAGLGKLWTIGDDLTERWCWASLASMPDITVQQPTQFFPTVLVFDRWSDWMDKFKTFHDIDAANTGDTNVAVTTPGNAIVNDLVVTLRADSWTNPAFQHSPSYFGNFTPHSFLTSRDITTNLHRIKIDAGQHSIGWSTDNGATYANDYANYTRPASQVGLENLIPGANVFLFQGTRTNSRVLIEYYAHWHD